MGKHIDMSRIALLHRRRELGRTTHNICWLQERIKATSTISCSETVKMPLPSKIPALPLEVVGLILELCTVPTLSRFASTSVTADELVTKELAIRRNSTVARFINNREAFFLKLTELHSILSGSAALAICTARDSFLPGDLDIYVPRHAAPEWADYLTTQEGYHVRPRPKARTEASSTRGYRGGIGAVITMARGTVTIDIVESLSICATLPIPFFWTTTVMTFVTGSGIVVLFPHLLEAERGLLTPDRVRVQDTMFLDQSLEQEDVDLLITLVAKYTSRGFDIRHTYLDWAREEDPDASCDARDAPACPLTTRWVGDRHTLTRAFGALDTRVGGNVLQGTLATTTTLWRRGGQPCGGPCTAFGTHVIPHVWCTPTDRVQ